MNVPWVSTARHLLLDQHVKRSGWTYRPDGTPFAEPTALAGLAMLATAEETSVEPAVSQAADWLADIQQADGSVGLSAEITTPGWSTPYAILLWSALGRYSTEREKAVAWLLDLAGLTRPPSDGGVIGHDRTIPGWPWVSETCSWLEPTALAVLTLSRERLASHRRVKDGIRMIRDRTTPSGAWNYGNSSMFNTPLHPQPAPTGLALLALRGDRRITWGLSRFSRSENGTVPFRNGKVILRSPLTMSESPDRSIQSGCRYLQRTLPRIRSPRSLCWGLLGLEAWQQKPSAADAWLAESFSRLQGSRTSAMDLAQLLLASSQGSLELLGIEATNGSPVQ